MRRICDVSNSSFNLCGRGAIQVGRYHNPLQSNWFLWHHCLLHDGKEPLETFARSNMLLREKNELRLWDGRCIVDLTPKNVTEVIFDAECQTSGGLSDTSVERYGQFQHWSLNPRSYSGRENLWSWSCRQLFCGTQDSNFSVRIIGRTSRETGSVAAELDER